MTKKFISSAAAYLQLTAALAAADCTQTALDVSLDDDSAPPAIG